MKEKYTIDDAQKYVAKNIADILLGLKQCKEVPEWMRESARFLECWKAGCWLNKMLSKELGATEKEVHEIGFAHGQRSTFGNTWEWAVRYANEYAENGSVTDKPGVVLADKINAAVFKIER